MKHEYVVCNEKGGLDVEEDVICENCYYYNEDEGTCSKDSKEVSWNYSCRYGEAK